MSVSLTELSFKSTYQSNTDVNTVCISGDFEDWIVRQPLSYKRRVQAVRHCRCALCSISLTQCRSIEVASRIVNQVVKLNWSQCARIRLQNEYPCTRHTATSICSFTHVHIHPHLCFVKTHTLFIHAFTNIGHVPTQKVLHSWSHDHDQSYISIFSTLHPFTETTYFRPVPSWSHPHNHNCTIHIAIHTCLSNAHSSGEPSSKDGHWCSHVVLVAVSARATLEGATETGESRGQMTQGWMCAWVRGCGCMG